MREVEIVKDPRAQRDWVATDAKSGEPVLRLQDRELLEKLCRNLGWEIVPTDAQRLQSEIDESDKGSTSTTGRSEGGNTEMAPSGVAIMAFFTVMAVMCVGGYFLLMKLIDISRLEDCMMQGRRNCMPSIELPAGR
jgi:hypothetical protein